jgi:hypothetical protein
MIRGTVAQVHAIARVCHEANRAWCAENGDDSQPPWDEAPAWQQQSAVDGVLGALNGNTPRESHEGWMRHKQARGWVYGEVKDPEARPPTHPCLVPYDDLPPEQKVKDHMFIAIVGSLGAYFTLAS